MFWPNRVGVVASINALPIRAGMPLGVTSTLDGVLREAQSISRNVGNMVHVEAPAKTFAVNRPQSCFGNWGAAGDSEMAQAAKVRKHGAGFDAACFSFANMIQNYADKQNQLLEQAVATWTGLATTIEHLDIPVYVFGIGLQEELPAEESAIPPALFRLLRVINDKAALFGVRGETTMEWLHRLGLRNARALGCPSMFVYPRNILSITAPKLDRNSYIGSAGRLLGGKRGLQRALPLKLLAETFRADYVFQNDIWPLTRGMTDRAVFDDATGLLDRDFMRQVTRARLGFESPFLGHYLFRDTARWRMFAHLRDAYVGDRFHGGVVFLQAGRPTLILQADARVRELTGYLGIPTLPVDQLATGDVEGTVAGALSEDAIGRFHETYRRRLAEYVEACEGAGLSFADRATITEILGGAAA
jgi:hypothetical protein